MKAIQFTKEQIEARINGATMFIVPVSEEITPIINPIDKEYGNCLRYKYIIDSHVSVRSYDEFYKEWSPIQKGDEFFIQESQPEFMINHEDEFYQSGTIPASQMQEHQSRFKDICLDIEVKRVQEITQEEAIEMTVCEYIQPIQIESDYNIQLKEQNIKGNYEDNPYIFLITCKGIQQ